MCSAVGVTSRSYRDSEYLSPRWRNFETGSLDVHSSKDHDSCNDRRWTCLCTSYSWSGPLQSPHSGLWGEFWKVRKSRTSGRSDIQGPVVGCVSLSSRLSQDSGQGTLRCPDKPWPCRGRPSHDSPNWHNVNRKSWDGLWSTTRLSPVEESLGQTLCSSLGLPQSRGRRGFQKELRRWQETPRDRVSSGGVLCWPRGCVSRDVGWGIEEDSSTFPRQTSRGPIFLPYSVLQIQAEPAGVSPFPTSYWW